MSQLVCPACGANVGPNDIECKYCGEKLSFTPAANQQIQQPVQQPAAPQPVVQNIYQAPASAVDPSWPIKSKTVAGLLGIFLGGLGIHKFYLGKVGTGILYLVFCWTYVPAIIGFIEGITYLCSNDENFELKHHVRVR